MTPLILFVCAVIARAAEAAPPFEQMPKVDVHAHYFDDMPEFAQMLERIDMKVVVICVFKNRPHMLRMLNDRAAELAEKYSPRVHFASTFDLTRIESPEFASETAAWLDRSFEAGAVMTKVWKEVGMQTKTASGEFVMPDSPLLDPVYAHLKKRGKPLMAHFADPIEAWRPLKPGSMHYNYFSNNPEWHMHGREGQPSHEAITAAYDRMLEKHPDLVVIGAHLGSLEHDLDALGRRFDRFPNFHVDVSARTPDVRRYPVEKVREFFIKYQDRLLYGLDQGVYTPEGLSAEQHAAYASRIEKWYRNEYDFYAGEELALPVEVLEKFYYKNAERILGGLD